MEDLFRQFWWLIFPIMGMLYGLFGMIHSAQNQNRAMDLLRTYAEQGKEPPPELLKALTHQASYDGSGMGMGGAGQDRITGAWWTFFVFIALAAGFSFGANSFASDAHGAFMIVAIVMGILAFGALIMALVATFAGRR